MNRATCLLLAYACVLSPFLQCVAQTDDESAIPKTSHKEHGRLTFTITDRRVIQSGSSDNSYNQAPAVVETASGNYLLSYKKGTNHVNDPYVVLRESSDRGATWGPELIQWNTSSPDPALARTPLARDLIIEFGKQNNSGTSGAAYARSTDEGSNWSEFTFFDSPVNNTYFTPTLYLLDDLTMYAAGYGPYGDGTNDAIIWMSTNDGYDWTRFSTVRQSGDAGINETTLAKVGPTTLLAVSRDDAGTHTWAHFSSDKGSSWGPQIDYTSQVGLLQLPQLLQTRKNLLLFGRNPAANELLAFASNDGGLSFRNRTVLDTYTGLSIDGGYCWPILRADGRVFVVYYADSNGLRLPDIKSLVLRLEKSDRRAAR